MAPRATKRRRNDDADIYVQSSTITIDENVGTNRGTITTITTTTTTTTTTMTAAKPDAADKKDIGNSGPCDIIPTNFRPSQRATIPWNPVQWLPEKTQTSPTCHKELLTDEDYRNLGFLPIAAFIDQAPTEQSQRCESRVYCVGQNFRNEKVVRVDSILITTTPNTFRPVTMRTTTMPLKDCKYLVMAEGTTESCKNLDASIGNPLCMSDIEMFQLGCYKATTSFDTPGWKLDINRVKESWKTYFVEHPDGKRVMANLEAEEIKLRLEAVQRR